MDDITIGVTEFVNNILVSAQPNDQNIDITVSETIETVLIDVSNTVSEVTVTATQNVIVENITVDYVNNENNIDINVTDATQDVTLNITPTLVGINILRSNGSGTILQFNTFADFPTTGSLEFFYLAKDTNKLYRWAGSSYVEISSTDSTAWGQITGTLSNQTDLQNALNLKAPINSPTFTGTVSGITKTMVGLGAVDNTSDLDKPISTATQTALNAKQPLDADLTSIAALSGTYGFLKKNNENSYSIDTNTYLTGITSSDVTTALGYTPENVANKGVNNGYASLDGGGKVPSSQLPSYVDDVIEVSSFATLPSTGETGKIYITLDTNKIYRWTGSVYVEISSSNAVWGAITGTLSNQTDLQNALNTYYPASNPNGYTSNVGTVTSVAMTVPSAFSVSGSPITSSGTLAITATGNTTQYIAGDGSLVTFPSVGTAGTLIREVRNTTGATLTKGTVVYISGATGNKPTVSKAIATGDSTSAQTFGLVQADIANNTNGNVVCVGDLTGIDTSAFTEGVQLYLSSTTAGAYTATKQLAPNHLVYIGVVTRSHPTLGQIEVNIQNGYELYELHDVSITSVANNQGLFYEASSDLWKNKSIATVLGYTPANGADYLPLTGGTLTGTTRMDGSGGTTDPITMIFNTGINRLLTPVLRLYGATNVSTNYVELIGTLATQNRTVNFPDASGTIALTSNLSAYLPLTGGTLTGHLTGTSATFAGGLSGSSYVTVSTSTNTGSGLYNMLNTSSVIRWAIGNVDLETGSNVGNNFAIYRYADNGSLLGGAPSLQITRSTGLVSIAQGLTIGGNLNGTNAYFTGNVGIGTSVISQNFSGYTHLDIGNATTGGILLFSNASGTNYGYVNGEAGGVNMRATVGNLTFNTGASERMRITSGGNVGIGTSTIPYLLTLALPSGVNGEIIRMSRSAGSYAWSLGIDSATSHFNFYNNSSSSVANINLSTGAYTATSDERLKENILDSDNAIEKLLQIKVRKYDWKDTDIKEDYGFVAQELYNVLPQYVSKGDEDRNWGVAKAELVPILVKAIQELKSELDTFKNK